MKFYKLQGAGNDFIIIDNIDGKIPAGKIGALAKALCARRVSIGADCLLLVGQPVGDADISVKVFNSDGSESEMCGNGMRCVARFAHESGLAQGDKVLIETVAGTVPAVRLAKNLFKIKLQAPSVLGAGRSVKVNGNEYKYTYIELGKPGIPHIVLDDAPGDLSKPAALLELARALRFHPDFPKGANVNFWRKRTSGADGDVTGTGGVGEDAGADADGAFSADLITYERGVEGFTLACGTGAGAAAVSLKTRGISGNEIIFYVPGGVLKISLAEKEERAAKTERNAGRAAERQDETVFDREIWLTGNAVFVARGETIDETIDLEEL